MRAAPKIVASSSQKVAVTRQKQKAKQCLTNKTNPHTNSITTTNTSHPWDVVKAAMEFQEFITKNINHRKNQGKPYFELRIGIHTGPVVAGIVGIKKFAYDIWGDTVNTASRMETSGEAGKVNISGATYDYIKDVYTCTYRGKISVKHKGEIDMYFIEGARN